MRRPIAAALLGISLWIGSLAWSGFVMTRTVLDPGRSQAVAEALLDNDAVRAQLVANIAGGIEAGLPDGARVDRATLEAGATQALDSPAVRTLVLDAFVRTHQAFLGEGEAPRSIDGGAFGAAARQAVIDRNPQLAGLVPEAPSFEVPLPTKHIPNLGPVRRGLLTAVPVLAGIATIGAGPRCWSPRIGPVSSVGPGSGRSACRRSSCCSPSGFRRWRSRSRPRRPRSSLPSSRRSLPPPVDPLWPWLAPAWPACWCRWCGSRPRRWLHPNRCPTRPRCGRVVRSLAGRERRDLPVPGRRPGAAAALRNRTTDPHPILRASTPPSSVDPSAPTRAQPIVTDATRVNPTVDQAAGQPRSGPGSSETRHNARWVDGVGWVHEGPDAIPESARWVPGVGYVLDD